MLMRRLALFIFITIANTTLAQVPQNLSSAEIYAGIKKLKVLGSILYVAAHPDDENTRLLAYLSKEKQYRTGYLSLTRGDGGQNLIGDEQGVELGMIRTQELLAARRVDGAEQFFTRAYDFGFSKTADETLKIWNKEKILSDVVWVIRKFQPDVIITRFPGDSRAGHGHHWSSALLANEAFTAAADPKRFPEQFEHGVQPWQAKRVVWNAFIFGSNTTPPGAFRLDVGAYNTLLGKSYGEIASESRSNHKSQGFGAARTRGQAFENFITTSGDSIKNDLMDGVVANWSRINSSNIENTIDTIIKHYSFEQPHLSVPALVDLYREIALLPDQYWKAQKLKELQQLIESAAGLFADANATQAQIVQGDIIRINFNLTKQNDVPVMLKAIRFEKFDTLLQSSLATNRNFLLSKSFFVDADKNISQPYWLHHAPNGSFEVRDQQMIGKPENDAAFDVTYTINIAGKDFTVRRPVQYKFTDPVKGEIYQPVVVLPKVEVQFNQENYVSLNGKPVTTIIHYKANKNDTTHYTINGIFPEGWKAAITSADFNASSVKGSMITTLNSNTKNINFSNVIEANATNHLTYNGYTKTISYDHIPTITYFPKATAHLVKLNIKTEGKRVGYISGAGDKMPEALEALGYRVVILDEANITKDKLDDLDAVITGIRAYNVHSYLTDKYDVLMNYVKEGGNLIVQYNTNNQVGPVRAKIGPYNFNISRTRVTEENAKVNFALPAHPVLNYPNKITEEDFENWVQERSVYEADQLDPAFVTPLAMNDTNEKEGKGSLIIAAYGKGNFVYTGLALFRQLPAGVPGAYRLLANLIALIDNEAIGNRQ